MFWMGIAIITLLDYSWYLTIDHIWIMNSVHENKDNSYPGRRNRMQNKQMKIEKIITINLEFDQEESKQQRLSSSILHAGMNCFL